MAEANIWQPRTIVDLGAGVKAVPETITAIEGQTVINILTFAYALDTGAILVFKNGEHQISGEDYAEGTDTSYTFVVPLTAGDKITTIGYIGISGSVDVRDTDIFLATHAALAAYTGIETTIYVKGAVVAGDQGAGWYQRYSGAAPGTYVSDGINTVAAIPGVGSIGWLREGAYDLELRTGIVNFASDSDIAIDLELNYVGYLQIQDTGSLLTAPRDVTVGTSINRLFVAVNDTAQPLTFKALVGTGTLVPPGRAGLLLYNGTEVITPSSALDSIQVGDLVVTNNLRIGLAANALSNNTLILSGAGNRFTVTGNITINTIQSKGAGSIVYLEFAGRPTIVAGPLLQLPRGVNMQLNLGDRLIFIEREALVWECISFLPYSYLSIIKSVRVDAFKTTSTLAEEADLSGTLLGINKLYTVTGYLYFNSLSNFPNVSLAMRLTASPIRGRVTFTNVVGTTVQVQAAAINTSAGTVNFTVNSVEGSTVTFTALVSSSNITNSTLSLLWSQDTASVNPTILRQGSWIKIEGGE